MRSGIGCVHHRRNTPAQLPIPAQEFGARKITEILRPPEFRPRGGAQNHRKIHILGTPNFRPPGGPPGIRAPEIPPEIPAPDSHRKTDPRGRAK